MLSSLLSHWPRLDARCQPAVCLIFSSKLQDPRVRSEQVRPIGLRLSTLHDGSILYHSLKRTLSANNVLPLEVYNVSYINGFHLIHV